jgi:hypothetical protein
MYRLRKERFEICAQPSEMMTVDTVSMPPGARSHVGILPRNVTLSGQIITVL